MVEATQSDDNKCAIEAESAPMMRRITDEAKDFLIVGLTGRTGANTGGMADFMCGEEILAAQIVPNAKEAYDPSERRDLVIAKKYLSENWRPFVPVSTTSVMLTFLLDLDEDAWGEAIFRLDENREIDVFEELGKVYDPSDDEFCRSVEAKLVAVNGAIAAHAPDPETCPDDRFVRESAARLLDDAPSLEALRGKWRDALKMLGEGSYESFDSAVIMFGVLPALAEALTRGLDDPEAYSLLFQRIGNNIRAYGSAYADAGQEIGGNIFEFSKRIDCFCRVLRHYGWAADASRSLGHGEGRSPRSGPVFIVVNSFKNIFEAYYLKRKYPTFYLMAISGDERREDGEGFLRERDRSRVDLGEDLSTSKNLFKRYDRAASAAGCGPGEEPDGGAGRVAGMLPGMSASQLVFCEKVARYDELRRRCYLGGFAPFILQDVMTCIENADVFATRDLSASKVCYDTSLVRSFARFMTLALHPGLLKPTKVERCMQTAMTAKLNSGCLSRQVGAVVADAGYQILSLGWNDVPCGSESCARRSLYDVATCKDEEAYSKYELGDPRYREFVRDVYCRLLQGDADEVLGGLPAAYCFKDAYQHIIGVRDQIHTRSLHAEERALAVCGNERAKGACLFTTSSPCELCAKKAREAQIEKIYYIEQYPGISHDHVIGDGLDGMRPSYEFFAGVVGAAYTELYTPLIPYKDELEALGISPRLLAK